MNVAAAEVIALLGAALLYFASPNEPVGLPSSLRRWFACAATLALIGATMLLSPRVGVAKAIFIAVTLAMLEWSLLPALLSWWLRRMRRQS